MAESKKKKQASEQTDRQQKESHYWGKFIKLNKLLNFVRVAGTASFPILFLEGKVEKTALEHGRREEIAADTILSPPMFLSGCSNTSIVSMELTRYRL